MNNEQENEQDTAQEGEIIRDVTRPDTDVRNWAMFCHLSPLIGYIIPLGSIIAPLVLWLMKREDMPFVDEQGKEVLYFQLTMLIGYLVGFILMLVFIGVLVVVILAIFNLIMLIIGAVRAQAGEHFHYPFSIRFIK